MFRNEGKANEIYTGKNVELRGFVRGNNNIVDVGEALHPSIFLVHVTGDQNFVKVSTAIQAREISIHCGTHVPAHNTTISIGKNFSVENNVQFILPNNGNELHIGDNCLFSNGIVVRCGDSPHLLFDSHTGEYLDTAKKVTIGHHVWVGERAYILKNTWIPDDCIVAACSVVTRRFSDTNCVIGGNPAAVMKKGISWLRNEGFVESGTPFDVSLKAFKAGYPF